MAIIIGPVKIDTTIDTFNFCGNSTPNNPGAQSFIDNWGPFPVSGLSVFGDFSGDGPGASWNSTDAGLTWTEKDSANEPQSAHSTWAGARVGSTFHLAAIDSATLATAFVKPYDLTSKTWGPSPAGLDLFTVGINTFRPYIKYAQRSDGTGVLLYFGRQTGATKRVLWAATDGATWTSSNNVIKSVADVNNQHFYVPYCSFVDSSDRVHFFFGTTTNAGDTANGLWYGVVNPDGTSSTTEVFTEAAYANSFQWVGMGCIWDNKICLPYGTGGALNILYGAPLNAPVFTNEVVSTVYPFNYPLTSNGSFATSCLVPNAQFLHAVWETHSFDDPTLLNYIYLNSRTTSTSWGSDDVILSSAVLNALNPGDEFWIHNISGNIIAPGIMGVIFDQTGSATMYYMSFDVPILGGTIEDSITFTDSMLSSVTSGPGPNPPPQPGPAPTACILQT